MQLEPLPAAQVETVGAEWTALERRAPADSCYLAYDWLAAWSRIYRPRRLSVIRIEEAGEIAALGLVEPGPLGRWRFAGAPVSAERGLLCADGAQQRCWRALGDWLGRHPRRWSRLDGEGMPEAAAVLPGARAESQNVPRLSLPDSFEAYLGERSAKTRKGIRQRLRAVERMGGRMGEVAATDRASALDELVALHAKRARSKGERHPEVDDRLARLLSEMASSTNVRLRVFALELDGRRVAVSARLDRGATAYSYNDGFDPSHADLSPGIALEVASIRQAIEAGLRDYDLGPGGFDFKLHLGGVPARRVRVRAASSSMVGRMVAASDGAYRLLRRRP